MTLATAWLRDSPDYSAPDGSEICLLLGVNGGGLCHCTLAAGSMSSAVAHRPIEEIWFFVRGSGEAWRKLGENESVVDVHSGVCISIPAHTHFQFRNTGDGPLCFLIATMPPWPGPQEAEQVAGYWPGGKATSVS